MRRERVPTPRPRFTPPTRRPARQIAWPRPAVGWRGSVVPAIVRTWTGLCFAAAGSLEPRFGEATLLVLAFVVSVTTAAIVYFALKMAASGVAGVLTPDILALALLVPVLAGVSDVQLSSERARGGSGFFLLAVVAVAGALGLIELLATISNIDYPERLAIGVLPAALSICAVVGGGERFSAGALTDGLSLAWMLAALVTVIDGFVRAAPNVIPIGAFVIVGVGMAVVGGRETSASGISTGSQMLAYLVMAIAGASLLTLPRLAEAITRSANRRSPPRERN